MKKNIYFILTIVFIFSCSKIRKKDSSLQVKTIQKTPPVEANNRYIVKYKRGITAKVAVKQTIHTTTMKRKGESPLYVIETLDPESFRKNPNVEYIEPDYKIKVETTSNDPLVGSQWGLENIGAIAAWASGNVGSSDVVLGLIDEGVFPHEELCPNFWTNPGEIAANGIDDDGNGYVDDINGYDFLNNIPDTYNGAVDDHGTHVMGIMMARGGNGAGIAGIAWKGKVIVAKFLQDYGFTSDAIEAFDYLTDCKIRYNLNLPAINNSWGGYGFSQSLLDAINRAGDAGILSVCASGNNVVDTDIDPFYPAAYKSPYVISVAATDQSNGLAYFSNYGDSSVHLGAPGVGILSTINPSLYATNYVGGYTNYSGTSMAAPHVTGAIALYRAGNPNATEAQTKSAILDNVVPTASLSGKTITGGRLNVSTFLSQSSSVFSPECPPPVAPETNPPSAPSYFNIDVRMDIGGGQVFFDFGDATDDTRISYYWLKLATNPELDPQVWNLFWLSSRGTNMYGNGIGPIHEGVTYWIAVHAVDPYNNHGVSSPILSFTPGPVTPPPTDTSSPVLNGGLSTGTITQTSIQINWPAASDNIAVTGYNLIINEVSNNVGNVTNSNATGFSPGTTHNFAYNAYDAAGNISGNSSTVSATTLTPPIYTLSSILNGSSPQTLPSINLSYTITTTGTISQVIMQRKKGGIPFADIATLSNNTTGNFTDNISQPGNYTYRLKTTITEGGIGFSNEKIIQVKKK